jgi:hypothetical protein
MTQQTAQLVQPGGCVGMLDLTYPPNACGGRGTQLAKQRVQTGVNAGWPAAGQQTQPALQRSGSGGQHLVRRLSSCNATSPKGVNAGWPAAGQQAQPALQRSGSGCQHMVRRLSSCRIVP